MLPPSDIRRHLAHNERALKVRSLYHRVMGELIVFKLTLDNTPSFSVTEDVDEGTVAVSIDQSGARLTAHLDQFDTRKS